jgi:hypothetical protein
MGFGHIFLRAAADVFAIGFGAHEGIVHFCQRFGSPAVLPAMAGQESMVGPVQRLPASGLGYGLVFLILHLKTPTIVFV